MEDLKYFLAGWGAGTFGVLVGYPMDTIKTYQQMSNVKLSTQAAVSKIIHKDGVHGLYKGVIFPLLSSGFLNSLYFGIYGVFLRQLQVLRGHDIVVPSNVGWLEDLFIAGSIGGAAQALITCPSELIKIRMQLGKEVPRTVVPFRHNFNVKTTKIIKEMYRYYGIRHFFIGFIPTLLRDALSGGIYMSCYQGLRHYMYGKLNHNPGLFEIAVAGGIAGVVAWVPVVPLDTIKSRMQASNFDKPNKKGMIRCAVDLFKVTHYHGFFKGFTMITLRAVPSNIAIVYGYELILWIFRLIDTDNANKLTQKLGKVTDSKKKM